MGFDQNIKNTQLPKIICKSLMAFIGEIQAGFPRKFESVPSIIQENHDI